MATLKTKKYKFMGSSHDITPDGPIYKLVIRFNESDGTEVNKQLNDKPVGMHIAYIDILRTNGFEMEKEPPVDAWQRVGNMDIGVLNNISISPVSNFQFDATLTYSWPNRPLLDGPWVYETDSRVNETMSSVDIENNPCRVEYRYPGISDTDYATEHTTRRLKRIIPVKRMRPLKVLKTTCRISRDIADSTKPNIQRDPFKFFDYVGSVNDFMEFDDKTIQRGIWLCASCRVFSRDQGETFEVEMQFFEDKRGHEDFIFWIDEMGNIPSTLTVPTSMKLAYPNDIDRIKFPNPYTGTTAGTTHPGGISRPKQLRLANGVAQVDGNTSITVDNFNIFPLNVDFNRFGKKAARFPEETWY